MSDIYEATGTTVRSIDHVGGTGNRMQAPMSLSIRTDFEMPVLRSLIERIEWTYNAGGMELVCADLRNLADALRGGGKEPAARALEEWLTEQDQRAA
jgi:hypothetical protein